MIATWILFILMIGGIVAFIRMLIKIEKLRDMKKDVGK